MEYSVLPLLLGSIAIAVGVVLTVLIAIKKLPLSLCIVDDSKVILVVGTYLGGCCFTEVQNLKQFIEKKKLSISLEDIRDAVLYRLAIRKVFLTVMMMTVISIALQAATILITIS